MKRLDVPHLTQLQRTTPMQEISAALDHMPKHRIDNAPWPEFNYVPEVSFSIAHADSCLLLKYYVLESVVKAAWFRTDDPVYKDSCVEFFISMGEDKAYYNFEFNIIGTCKLNYGVDRNERKVVSEKLISSIRYLSSMQNTPGADGSKAVHWELTLMIPTDAFSEHSELSLAGKKCRANFYKCGDDLPVPHYLCWNNIKSPQPDFHLSEYFGEVIFQ